MSRNTDQLMPTCDPGCFIEQRGESDGLPFIVYRNSDGQRWVIMGECIACGECEVGAINPNLYWTGVPIGQPGACIDLTFGWRLDVPVRPDLTHKMPHCSLSGVYL